MLYHVPSTQQRHPLNPFLSIRRYTFYDGPPFATGTPHYGHILAGTIKVCVIVDVDVM